MDVQDFFLNYTGEDWEKFCEIMLRHHYGQECFYPVPAADGGDHGIEFFTSDGTIFQCYFPEVTYDIKTWKSKVKDKINKDLNKLKSKGTEVEKMLGDITIKQWVLLTPKNLSKDLLKYCIKKKMELLSAPPKFIDKDNFNVRIETADSYPSSKRFALSCSPKKIDLSIFEPSDEFQDIWKKADDSNKTNFLNNINRKSENLMGERAERFKEKVIEKYIQMDKFLEDLRTDYPDQHTKIEDTARGLLRNIKDLADVGGVNDAFIMEVLTKNQEAFKKYSEDMSDDNLSVLSFGYISKWIAECNMDFR